MNRLEITLDVLNSFAYARGDASAMLIATFIEICLAEGQSVKELARKRKVGISTTSRHLAVLSEGDRTVGLRLIKLEEDEQDKRSRRVHLTKRGEVIRDLMLNGSEWLG